MRIAIVIPAYNEEQRIGSTLRTYGAYFDACPFEYTLIVVLNGCTDRTAAVVAPFLQKEKIEVVYLKEAGKGIAIKQGFLYAVCTQRFDYIGFVDADMATHPAHFHALMTHMVNNKAVDGVIASRYAKGAHIVPERPFIKRWGSKLIYETCIRWLFRISYSDYQCGAKLFKAEVIATVAPLLRVRQWAFDVELLYLCKKNGYIINELPTVWYDQAGSKLKLTAGFFMIGHLLVLRLYYWIQGITNRR